VTARRVLVLLAALFVLAHCNAVDAAPRSASHRPDAVGASAAGWPSGAPLPGDRRAVVVRPEDARSTTSGAPSDPTAPPVDHAGTPVVVPSDAPAAKESVPVGLVGVASWFCHPPTSPCTTGYAATGAYAAAGPALRAGLGPDWRGQAVSVAAGGRSVVVTLVDVCACPGGRIVDLYASQFGRLAPLDRGLVLVRVEAA